MQLSNRYLALGALGVSCFALGMSALALTRAATSTAPTRSGAPAAPGVPSTTGDVRAAVAPATPVPVTARPGGNGHAKAPDAAPSARNGDASKEDTADGVAPLVVKRVAVTHELKNREPVAGPIETGKPVIAFLEVQNRGDDADRVEVTFEHSSGRKVGHVKLEVPARQKRWRTWARTRLVNKPGEWTVVVKQRSGNIVARQPFSVK